MIVRTKAGIGSCAGLLLAGLAVACADVAPLDSDSAATPAVERVAELSSEPAAESAPAVVDEGGPPGMRAVTGGWMTVGDEEAARMVLLEPFWIDPTAQTADDYRRCIQAGACLPPERPPVSATGAVLVDWSRAEHLCAFAGKRLPAEAEWEAAAQAGVLAPDPEWTRSWYVAPAECPSPSAKLEGPSQGAWAVALCGGRDPLDACDGAAFCGHLWRKVVKDPAAPGGRRGEASGDDLAQQAVRCATSWPHLTRFPSSLTTAARPRPPDPEPPTQDELAHFATITEDVLDTPPCDKPGRSFLDCRDPHSYLKTNEPWLHVVGDSIRDLGGGYAGVGSDQNYTLVAIARSQWAWVFDYDPNVVRWHRVLRAMILDAPDRAAFVARFTPAAAARGAEVLAAVYAGDSDLAALQGLYRTAAPRLASHYEQQSREVGLAFTWLGADDSYAYVRRLYQQGRIRILAGNMLDSHTMVGIGDAARALGVPVRIYYPSNAPEFWELTAQYRKNVQGLPFDERSVVVQTISSLKTGFGQLGYWHYNIQDGHAHQALLELPGYTRLKQLLYHRVRTDSSELTLSDVLSEPETSPAALAASCTAP